MNFKRALVNHVQERALWENVSHVQEGGTMCQDIMGMQLRFINRISNATLLGPTLKYLKY